MIAKETLESYSSKKEEIRELQYKLQHMNDDDKVMGNDTILDYKKGYPVPQAVVGVDWDKISRTEERYKKRIDALTKECEEVEEFVETIQDSLTRRIFRLYYIEGLSQHNVSKLVHMAQSKVSEKISFYLKSG